jgi:tetratricopeptide (TPR) repeat protein
MDEIELYRQIMSKDPSSQAFVYLAEALWERGMYTEAVETCVNGLRLHPHDLRARVILGLSCLRNGELDRAETELLKAKEMLEINAVTYQALAELYDDRGDTEQAARYRQLFETIHSPETAEVETEAVEPEIESLPEEIIEGEREVATVSMAELYAEQGRLDEAIEMYRRIIQSSPETEGVEDRLAELENQVDKDQAARTVLTILEAWQNKLQNPVATGTTSPSIEPTGIDPKKLAAIVQNCLEKSRTS